MTNTRVPTVMMTGIQALIDAAVAAAVPAAVAAALEGFDTAGVLSVNGETGVLTGYAKAADVTDEIADAIGEIDLGAVAGGLVKSFVASGALTNGQRLALRTDGKVEAVAGSETLFSVGADNTALTVANEFRVLDGAYNATTGKLALLYCNLSTTRTIYLVLATVADGVITFGTPVTVATGLTHYNAGKVIWNAAGTLVFVTYNGNAGYSYFRAATVSGTVPTLGLDVSYPTGTGIPALGFWINETSSKIVIARYDACVTVAYASSTLGTVTGLAWTSPTTNANLSVFYDKTNNRVVRLSFETSTTYIQAMDVSGSPLVCGAQESVSTYLCSADMDNAGKLLVIGASGSSRNRGTARVVTFAGTVVTINAGVSMNVSLGATASLSGRAQVVFDPTAGKMIIAAEVVGSLDAPLGTISILSATISGTSASFSDPWPVYSRGYASSAWQLLVRGAGDEVALLIDDTSDGNRRHVITAKLQDGKYKPTNDNRIKDVPMQRALNQSARFVQAGWALWDIGNWTPNTIDLTNYSSTALTTCLITLPTEATNADSFIGVAQADAADAANVSVALKGGIAAGLSGLTPRSRYFLKGDGTLITTDNGRPAGIALSATELLLAAA